MTKEEFLEWLDKESKLDFEDVNIDEIPELSEIKINKNKSKEEKILQYLKQNKHPYFMKINGKLVKSNFSENSSSAQKLFDEYIKSMVENIEFKK